MEGWSMQSHSQTRRTYLKDCTENTFLSIVIDIEGVAVMFYTGYVVLIVAAASGTLVAVLL
jgi:hypothetical protein